MPHPTARLTRPGSDPRRAARPGRLGARADRRRPAQGLRPSRSRGHPDHSTIASHLPRAVGIGVRDRTRYRQIGLVRHSAWPADAIVGRARSATRRSTRPPPPPRSTPPAGTRTPASPLPVLFVCEDNGIGVSVRSPDGWVADVLRARPGLRYFAADGCDLAATYDAAAEAADWVREQRRPAVLHLSVVRLMGHAGADAEVGLPDRRRDRRGRRPAIRWSRPPNCSSPAGVARRRPGCSPGTTRSAGRCARSPRR